MPGVRLCIFLSTKLCLAVPAAVTGTPFLQRDAELESAAPQLDREAQGGKLHITKTMLVKFGRSVNCAGAAKPHTDACRDRIGQTQPRGTSTAGARHWRGGAREEEQAKRSAEEVLTDDSIEKCQQL